MAGDINLHELGRRLRGEYIGGIDVHNPPIQSVTPAGIQLVTSAYVPEGTWIMSEFREPEDFERQFMVRPMSELGGPDLKSFEDRVTDVMRTMWAEEPGGRRSIGVMTVDPPKGPAPKFEGELQLLTADTKAPDEYLRLAEKLGVVPKTLSRIIFRRFLQAEEIPVYEYTAVDRYLLSRCKWMQTHKPMRGGYYVEWSAIPVKGSATEGILGQDVGTIPIEALQTIERVMDNFPDAKRVEWYVSEIKGDPDPFLAAKYMGEMYVLFHWDEPGFSVLDK